MDEVDLVLLSRDDGPPRPDVWAGIQSQQGVRLHVHRLIGGRLPGDPHRIATIARARNRGRWMGSTPFSMMLDDDVVLGPRCVAALVEGLRRRPGFAALGADSANEMRRGLDNWDYPRHVGMAALMFRRERLQELEFRWEPGKCECRCCCEDLRRAGFGVGYLQGAEAWHRPSPRADPEPIPLPADVASPTPWPRLGPATTPPPDAASRPLPGRVMTAFDRKHLRLFLRRFVGTFRREGNTETITAVATGLRPSERRLVAALPGVELETAPEDGHPAKRRLLNFRRVVSRWPDETPVAYWDAGDVVFQARVAPLWGIVRANPGRVLAAAESQRFRESGGALWWVITIRDDEARRRALELLSDRHVLNSGFMAGTAWAMTRYLDAATAIHDSPALAGSTDFGDQTAMNLYLYSNPDAWLQVHSGWNYCLVAMGPEHFHVRPDGRTERLDGEPLYVAHGAGKSLQAWDIVHLTS